MQIGQLIDFTAFKTGFGEWWSEHLEIIKGNFGEGEAYAEAVRLLEDDPWQALLWYVEDTRRGLQEA